VALIRASSDEASLGPSVRSGLFSELLRSMMRKSSLKQLLVALQQFHATCGVIRAVITSRLGFLQKLLRRR
jgi:hypothetical protein